MTDEVPLISGGLLNAASKPIYWLGEEPGQTRKYALLRREGHRVILRKLDSGEPEPDRIPIYAGEVIEVAHAVHSIAAYSNADQGDVSALLFGLRLKYLRREGRKVFARTLRFGEDDNGAAVHVAAGEELVVEEIHADLDHIDSMEPPTQSGHRALAPTFGTWLSVARYDELHVRYLLAAARRLDAANLAFISASRAYTDLSNDLAGPVLRRTALELLSWTETLMVALGRVLDMALKARAILGTTVRLPSTIRDHELACRTIRNAIEHIEDRAQGQVRGQLDPVALTLFDQSQLLTEGVISYGPHRLDLMTDVPELIAATRAFFFTGDPGGFDCRTIGIKRDVGDEPEPGGACRITYSAVSSFELADVSQRQFNCRYGLLSRFAACEFVNEPSLFKHLGHLVVICPGLPD